ncbi:MAG: phytanoyl-CoA dioxygenase family protein [Burkholderiales bacterium]
MNLFSPQQIGQFDRDGFLIVRGLASREQCERMMAVAQRHLVDRIQPLEYEAEVRYPGSPDSLEAAGGDTVRRLLQAYARDDLFRDWARAPEISARLRQLLGPDVALSQTHHNCVMTKNPAFSSATGWHQDIRYWSFEKPDLVSVWLALGTEGIENGCLWLVPGTHKIEFSRDRYDNARFFRDDIEDNREILALRVAAALGEGDVLFFHCRTLHAAGRNLTGKTKFAAVFTYHAADNRALPGTRSASLSDIELGA